MGMRKVLLFGRGLLRFVIIDDAATKGAVVGDNLKWSDGEKVKESEIKNTSDVTVAPASDVIRYDLDSHKANTSNPHSVAHGQLGGVSADQHHAKSHAHDGSDGSGLVAIATGVGSPTVDKLQEYFDNTGSSGFFLGGELSDGGAGTLDVAAGSGFSRATNDPNAELQSFKWSASAGIAVPDDTTQYVYVDDEGAISLSTDEFLEAPDLLLIGVVTDEGGAIESVFSLGVRLAEGIGQAGRFIRRVHGVTRDKRRGGLIFGQSGDANRDVTMSAGELWWGRTEYPISVFNTSGADTFAIYSAGGQEAAAASQWPNTQYDNAGTLTTLGNNKWANLFFYVEPDDHIVMIYGRAQFNSQVLAEGESVPVTSLPSRITQTGVLAARFTFKKSENTAIISISADFDAVFVGVGVTDTIVGISGTKAEFDTAVTDGNIAYVGGAYHDGFSDFVSDEHLPSSTFATAAQGALADSALQSIVADSITMDMLVDIATDTFLGRITAATGTVEVLTNAQAKTALDLSGINSGDQTSIVGIGGTKAEFDTELSDGDFIFVGDAPTAHTHAFTTDNRKLDLMGF